MRAQRKIALAGIPYCLPREDELDARLQQVLAVLYLMFNEGNLASSGQTATRHDTAEDAAWLAELMCQLFPREPEPLGLLALTRLHLARASARFDPHGELILLRFQDRSFWDRRLVGEGVALIERAAALRRPGPYQLQAAIAACHVEASSWETTDWAQILILYDFLLALALTPVVRLNRAVALNQLRGPWLALAEVELLTNALNGYHLFHALRAELLRAVGQADGARLAEARALALTRNPAEKLLLQRRLAAC